MKTVDRYLATLTFSTVLLTQIHASEALASSDMSVQPINVGVGVNIYAWNYITGPTEFATPGSFNYDYPNANYYYSPYLTTYDDCYGYSTAVGLSSLAYGSQGANTQFWVVNSMNVPESVRFSLIGYAYSTVSVYEPWPVDCVAKAFAGFYDLETQSTVCEFQADLEAKSPVNDWKQDTNQLYYTITVAPGATYELLASTTAYHYVSIAPSPAAAAPFILGLVAAVRRRRKA